MSLVYPRLPAAVAEELAAPLIAGEQTVDQAALSAAPRHSRAAPIATGGSPVTESGLELLRESVLSELASLGARSAGGDFDLVVGRALHEGMRISRADAGSGEVWNFLNLVLLPDVVLRRFSQPKRERLIGARPRNALRRLWFRHDVLGDLLIEGPTRLTEDELVGLTERTSLVRNRELARLLAREVMTRPGRSEGWAREYFRRVRWKTGPLLLDVLSDAAVEEMTDEVARQVDDEIGYRRPEQEPVRTGATRYA